MRSTDSCRGGTGTVCVMDVVHFSSADFGNATRKECTAVVGI